MTLWKSGAPQLLIMYGKVAIIMKIYKAKDYDELSRKAASIIASQVLMKPDCVLGLATGSIPVLLCPLFQTVNAVGVPEIVDSGAVPGMGDAGLPEKAPEVFIDIPQCHRLFTVTWEKIS